MIKNWQQPARKQPWPQVRYYGSICLERLRKPWKLSWQLVSWVQIWTWDLQDMKARLLKTRPQHLTQNSILTTDKENDRILFFFIMFILCIFDDELTTLISTKCTILSPGILYYNITLNNPTCFDPLWNYHQGITLNEKMLEFNLNILTSLV